MSGLLDPRSPPPPPRSDPAAISRVFRTNLALLALFMLPGGLVAATTKIRHASGLTYLALFAFLVLPLLHGVASVLLAGRLRRSCRDDLGAGLRRSGKVILAIWLITWVVVIVVSSR